MILWFAGLAVAIVWNVFRDTAIDYRLIAVGALLPDVIDVWFGGPRVAHSLAASAALLTVVMLATRGRRVLRRQLLAVPIGMFLHLVLDGMWTDTTTFWWPFAGSDFPDGLPSLERPVAVIALAEAAGAAALVWFWRRWDLANPQRRATFWRTGRLDRELAG